MDVDMSDGEDETVSPGGTKLSPELQARFEEYNIVQVVLEKVELPAVNVCAILRGEDDYKHLMDKIIKLQCTGFLCINNLVSCLDIPAETLFTEFVKILRHHYNDDLSEEQSESLTCALRSLVLSLDATLQGVPQVNDQGHPVLVALEKGNLSGGNAVLPDEFLNSISKLLVAKLTGEEGLKNGGSKGQKLKSGGEGDKKEVGVKVKENLVKVVATWTTILLRMKRPNSTEHDTFVLSNLLHFLDNTEDLILLAETLDCLIDLFSDDDTDVLAKQVNLTGKLTANEPKLKSMIKSNKKTLDSEKLALVSTVQTNLHAFIQYKRQRVANVK
ncbi:hypothetical protein M8J76_014213 [Diaphorina citri]|nr:hypothetical protein M8J76_014213 [Diaphorina citri]